MRVLVTGASGFVGTGLLTRLIARPGYEIVAAYGRHAVVQQPAVASVHCDLSPDFDWRAALAGVDVVVHLAARVHVMNDTAADPLIEFRRVNVAATLNLARQAVAAGVRRFVFVSSVKVNGEETQPGQPFTAEDVPAPEDPYGVSKLEAEQGLRQLALETGIEVVIIRPPLVYGPGVKANFNAMMRWLNKGIPLPLGAIGNQRSLVSRDNLVDLILTCLDHPAAANQVFMVSDGEDLSTTQLLRRMGKALGCEVRLLPVPAWLIKGLARSMGKSGIAKRLCGSLQVSIVRTRDLLGWSPVVSVDEGLGLAAVAFLDKQRS